MNRKPILSVLLSLAIFPVLAQGYSLNECIDYASKSHGSIVNANRDLEIADRKIKETVGGMLPQIDGSSQYTDNLKMQTTMVDGAMFGAPGTMKALTFGTKHNFGASVQLSQKLFDPTFGIGLKAAKVSLDQSQTQLQLTKEQIAYNISVCYFQTLVIDKQRKTLQSTLKTSKKQLETTQLRFETGTGKEIDVDKIRVGYNNLISQLEQVELSYTQSLNNLKYYMGMPVENTISLTDTTLITSFQPLDKKNELFDPEKRSDFQLQKIAIEANELDKKRNQVMYLPTLSASLSYGVSAQRKTFNYFEKNQNWPDYSALVFSLRVPIFDGLQKHQRIQQSKLNIEKAKTKLDQTKQAIQLEQSNYENQYQTAINNIQNEKSNMELAQKVYQKTLLSYEQGMVSAFELIQSENSWNESLNNYYAKLLNAYIAKINLEQSKGNLINYISNK